MADRSTRHQVYQGRNLGGDMTRQQSRTGSIGLLQPRAIGVAIAAIMLVGACASPGPAATPSPVPTAAPTTSAAPSAVASTEASQAAASPSASAAATPSCGTDPVVMAGYFETGFDLPYKLTAEFTKEFPNVTWNISQDQFANLMSSTSRLLSSDNPPDLIRLPSMVSLVKDQLLLNLDS